jgi:hypothetical protein
LVRRKEEGKKKEEDGKMLLEKWGVEKVEKELVDMLDDKM